MHNVHFPTPAMMAAMRHALPDLISRYGSTQEVLNEKLSWFVGCDPARLQVVHGASQAFPILADLVGARMVGVPDPTFGEFRRAFPGAVTYTDGPGVDLDELEELAARVDLLAIVNPNNPTGTTLGSTGLHELIGRHPNTRFLLDESFIEFSGEPSMVMAVEQSPLDNVAVLVSLSKTLGVPGLRLGYVYSCDARFVSELGRRLPIWNLGSVAEFFLELLLKFRPELARSVERTILDREEFRRLLQGVAGVRTVHPSGGNFVLVDLEGPSRVATEARAALLRDARIDVKDLSGRFADGAPRLRVAVRRSDENVRFTEALEAALKSMPW